MLQTFSEFVIFNENVIKNHLGEMMTRQAITSQKIIINYIALLLEPEYLNVSFFHHHKYKERVF